MSNMFKLAMNELEILERDLEEAVTEKERQEIENAIRNIERDLREGNYSPNGPFKIKCVVCDEEFEIENDHIGVIVCPECGAWTEDLKSWFSLQPN